MKLIRAQVHNFRSAEDTGEFNPDAVTCLVGKNEAGKTAVLLALAALNLHPSTPFALDKERDYPRRHLTNYNNRHPDKDAIAVTTTWQLEEPEKLELESEFGKGLLQDTIAKAFRRYGASSVEWSITLNFKSAFEHLFDRFHLSQEERTPLATMLFT